ncbi:olfactomedin-4-like [Rhynchocyon petersi]
MQLVSTLLTCLLLMLLVFPGQPELVKRIPGFLDNSGTCYCAVYLSKNSIPQQQLEELQSTTQELMSKFEKELSRLRKFAQLIEDQDNQVLEMAYNLQSRALSSSYEAHTFHVLRLELEGIKKSVTKLKTKGGMSGSWGLFNQLQGQVANASSTLKSLSDSDQRSFHALRQEVDILEGDLRQCERMRQQEHTSSYSGPPLPPGSCAHAGLHKVSKPLVVQLNWRGDTYKAGAWGRDSAPDTNTSFFWVAPLNSNGRYSDYFRLYKSYDDLVLFKNYKEVYMTYGDGSGYTVYKNFIYFNYYGTNDMAKVNLSTNTLLLKRSLPGASFNNRFSYAGVGWKDIDFSSDEKGLWVLYATEESKGNLVVSLLNDSTLEVEKTWPTSQYKPALSGAFMACGVLYALRPLSTRHEEIFYAFDTNTGKERYLSILLDKMLETLHGINYCPLDHKLYVFNDGYLINYDLTFLTRKFELSRQLPKKPFKAYDLSKHVKSNKTFTAWKL